MHAYYSDYVKNAQRIMGDMFDYAVNTCDMEPDKYFEDFLASGVAEQFGRGNPKYVTGMTGCELVKKVMEKSGTPINAIEEEMYLDKSPEYWLGWALAYYQWYSGKTFAKIQAAVSMHEILGMYTTLHEADISKFISIMDEKLVKYYLDTNLKQIRVNAGLSQNELAKLSGVNIRQIQLFEQRKRDINKTQVLNVFRLAQTLGCRVEDLIEI